MSKGKGCVDFKPVVLDDDNGVRKNKPRKVFSMSSILMMEEFSISNFLMFNTFSFFFIDLSRGSGENSIGVG